MKEKNDLRVRIARKITEFPADEWDKFFPGILENHAFFKSLDESNFTQFPFFYTIAYDGATPQAAAPFFIMRFPVDIAAKGVFKLILSALKKIIPAVFNPRTLVCGLPMGQGRIGVSGDLPRAAEAIYNTMEEIARKEKVAIFLFKDFNSSYEHALAPFLEKGFFKIESFPFADMDISFKSFEEYLKTLSPVSRSGVKRKFKKIDGQVKIDLEIIDKLEEPVLSEAHALYLQTFEKNDLGFELVPKGFFKNIAKNMPQETKFFLWRIKGKLAAFAFCLTQGTLFIDYYLGFDYALAYEYNLYFIRFRDLLNWCIAHGIKKYEMGATGYESKRRLNFHFVRLYFYIKHKNPLMHSFFKVLSHLAKPENFDPIFAEIKKSETA